MHPVVDGVLGSSAQLGQLSFKPLFSSYMYRVLGMLLTYAWIKPLAHLGRADMHMAHRSVKTAEHATHVGDIFALT